MTKQQVFDMVCSASEVELQNFTGAKLKEMYAIFYTTPLRRSARKKEIVELLKLYVRTINRARSLKP